MPFRPPIFEKHAGENVTACRRRDGTRSLSARDSLYPKGMAGLLAGQNESRVDMPYDNNLVIQEGVIDEV